MCLLHRSICVTLWTSRASNTKLFLLCLTNLFLLSCFFSVNLFQVLHQAKCVHGGRPLVHPPFLEELLGKVATRERRGGKGAGRGGGEGREGGETKGNRQNRQRGLYSVVVHGNSETFLVGGDDGYISAYTMKVNG